MCSSDPFGAAVLAAAGATGEPLGRVAGRMVGVAEHIEPDPRQTRRLDDRYHTLLDLLRTRGLLDQAGQPSDQPHEEGRHAEPGRT